MPVAVANVKSRALSSPEKGKATKKRKEVYVGVGSLVVEPKPVSKRKRSRAVQDLLAQATTFECAKKHKKTRKRDQTPTTATPPPRPPTPVPPLDDNDVSSEGDGEDYAMRFFLETHFHHLRALYIDYLPHWIAACQNRGEHCLVIMVGAPGSGKSTFTAQLKGLGDCVPAVVSNDLQPGLYKMDREGRAIIYAPTHRGENRFDFPLFKRLALDPAARQFHGLLARPTPQAIVLDDTNTVFTDWQEKVRAARAAGVPLQNITFLVADHQLALPEEVQLLVQRQQRRKEMFWAQVDEGAKPNPSDGKVVPEQKIRQMVERLRLNYFDEQGSLLHFTTDDLKAALEDVPAPTIVYSALFLSTKEEGRLREYARTVFGEVLPCPAKDLHCTLRFGHRRALSREEKDCIGKWFDVTVTGRTPPNPRVQALAISHNCPLPCENKVPHITVAMAVGARPVESNDALAAGVDPAPSPFTAQARMGVAASFRSAQTEILYRF